MYKLIVLFLLFVDIIRFKISIINIIKVENNFEARYFYKYNTNMLPYNI